MNTTQTTANQIHATLHAAARAGLAALSAALDEARITWATDIEMAEAEYSLVENLLAGWEILETQARGAANPDADIANLARETEALCAAA